MIQARRPAARDPAPRKVGWTIYININKYIYIYIYIYSVRFANHRRPHVFFI